MHVDLSDLFVLLAVKTIYSTFVTGQTSNDVGYWPNRVRFLSNFLSAYQMMSITLLDVGLILGEYSIARTSSKSSKGQSNAVRVLLF